METGLIVLAARPGLTNYEPSDEVPVQRIGRKIGKGFYLFIYYSGGNVLCLGPREAASSMPPCCFSALELHSPLLFHSLLVY